MIWRKNDVSFMLSADTDGDTSYFPHFPLFRFYIHENTNQQTHGYYRPFMT